MRCFRIVLFSFVFINLLANFSFAADNAIVSGLRYSTDDNRLRVVVDIDKNVEVKKIILSNPVRVVVDIKNASLNKDAKKDIDVRSKFGSHIKIAQFNPKTVRVVINTLNSNHNVFTMENPHRVVIDIGNGNIVAKKTEPKIEPKSEAKKETKKDTAVKEKKEKNKEEKKEEKRKREEIRPVADNEIDREIAALTGLGGKIIAIDPGHGGSDAGAIGPTGAMEKNVTLDICLELKKILEDDGATVVMTRESDVEVSPKKSKATDVEELQARVDIANESKADIFLSIHMDSFTNRTARGTTGYYFGAGGSTSRSLADKVRANIVDQLGTMSRGTQTCNFYVVKHTDMPATLIEVAFISYPDEEKLLTSKEGVRKAATAIADGISDYFG
ncbi:MAG: N-acetylmuramoyl-L-alanine amidase [Selenomonadaceae bacterium]|nr:N-acetylmuramoyl-L-alanine amidase [Selenomonadaceae bacterium]